MDADRFVVVRNAEDQYSVWFAGRELPLGWEPVSFEGSRAQCLERIRELWQDLRPLSLRTALGREG